MMQAVPLADGRLHLQHGPIDCLIQAWGVKSEIDAAYARAMAAFAPVLEMLCRELPLLRQPVPSPTPTGEIARAMHAAVLPYRGRFITPMAAVAGAVADHVLAAMLQGGSLDRACVNNGGDIAFHLAPGQSLRCALVSDLGHPSVDGVVLLDAHHKARGLATSGRACKGRGGKSFSLGIADSVTVLAHTAAQADAAATVIANAVDLPGHVAIHRRPACDIDPDSDLGGRMVTWDLGRLTEREIAASLDAGAVVADDLRAAGDISGAVLCLRGQVVLRSATVLELA
jgi:ApbE superfamily uncharacterized protein (UPF0280 family)